MEIKQLITFVAIAESKTFTAGAHLTNVSQAAVSVQIRQLEEELGLQLFTRTPRRVILTQAGEKLYEGARKILREYNAALAEMKELAGSEHGRLRIGSASAMFATRQLPTILQKLKKKFPQAEITVSSGTSQVLVEKITQGEIDIAFVSFPVDAPNIMTVLLFSDEIIAIASPSHSLSKQKVISAATLADEPLILGEKGGNIRRMIDKFFVAADVKPNIVMELSRQETINQMVENNMGVGIAGAKTVFDEIKHGRLISWLIEGAEIKWELGLARLRGGYFPPIAKEFINLCKESFKKREKGLKDSDKN